LIPHRRSLLIKKIPTSNKLTLAIQLGLLKLISLQDVYAIRVQGMPKTQIPSYLFQEWQTWLRSGEAEDIWRRFQVILGRSGETTVIQADSEAPPVSLEMVMKYDRSILYYLPQPYQGHVKFFCSEEWRRDSVNWQAWAKWYAGTVDRYDLLGSHTTFYRKSVVDLVDKLLPLKSVTFEKAVDRSWVKGHLD
jgi:hypothetical protein